MIYLDVKQFTVNIMKVKSVTNVITNSSSETFLVVNENAIDTVKNFINAILEAAGSEKTCDELFDITPSLCEDIEEYWEDWEWKEEYLEKKFKGHSIPSNFVIPEEEKQAFILEKAKKHDWEGGEESPCSKGIKIKPKSGVNIPDLDGINNIFCSEERYC